MADISPDLMPDKSGLDAKEYREIRENLAGGNGLLTIHVISSRSIPMRKPKPGAQPTREAMDTDHHLVGIGVVFPGQEHVADERDGNYYTVHPDWQVPDGDLSEFPEDTEPSAADDDDFAWLTA